MSNSSVYVLTSDVPWGETMQDLNRTMRKWGVTSWQVDPVRQPEGGVSQRVTLAFVHPQQGAVQVSRERPLWPARLNLRSIYLSLEDLRMVERRGDLDLFTAVLAQLAPPRRETAAHRVLGVSAGATLEEIKRAYRRLARDHHPDLGGDTATMQAINTAYRELLAGEGA